MNDRSVNTLMARAKQLYAVRDAIRDHLGEEGARMLGIECRSCSWGDGIEVSTPDVGFVIMAHALADNEDAWRAALAWNLDRIVERPC